MSDNQNEKEENVFPWKEKMRQAGQGDTGSVLELCEEIRPIVEGFSRNGMFCSLFSAEDTRSMASLAALEFMMGYEGDTPDREIPYLLRRVIRCRLYDEARRLQTRQRYEVPDTSQVSEDNDGDKGHSFQTGWQDGETPETLLLSAERSSRIQNALKMLNPKEQEVLRAIYAENKSSSEIARQWHCTSRYVIMVKHNALNKLKILLKDSD